MSDEGSGASDNSPKDGAMNFSHYSDAQLVELRDHLDAARFPKNFQNLLAEIDHREESHDQAREFAVRYSSANGLAGWLQAKSMWQPLYGGGSISIQDSAIALRGWQRTWLGLPQHAEIIIPAEAVRNAYRDDEIVSFERKVKWRMSRRFVVRGANPGDAAAIIALLPSRKSKWFEKKSASVWEFYRLLRSPNRRVLVTPALVIANLLVYLALAIRTGAVEAFDGLTLSVWGANYGPLTAGAGQWWRLLSAMFLHLNLLHIVVNMWVLWSVGRLTERLYRNVPFLAVYLVAGIVGGLASIAWNPAISTVGASGAIFGVLGALIAYLMASGTRVPLVMLRAHFIPTVLFIAFSLANGILQTGIDNAAHVGGLMSGFLLGIVLARPPEGVLVDYPLLMRRAIGLTLFAGVAGVSVWYAVEDAAWQTAGEQYLRRQDWYAPYEARNLEIWQDIAARAESGSVSAAELSYLVEKNILPFWQNAAPRLSRQVRSAPDYQKPYAATMADFAAARLRWAKALIAYANNQDQPQSQEVLAAMQQTDQVQAHLDRLFTRASFDRRAKSLSASPPIVAIENLADYSHWKCVNSPFAAGNPVSPTDSLNDGPARNLALACQAQHLFLTRDFPTLEKLLNRTASHLNDLLDGSSSFNALMVGLDNLSAYSGLSIGEQLDRTAAWRREIPGSVQADLVEAIVLFDWGYAARGHGTADTISQQNLMMFTHRVEMAAAALRAVSPRAANNPEWYEMALEVGLIQEIGDDNMRKIFERGRDKFPTDYALYSAMLHSLMPRWGGSYEKVGRFVADQALHAEQELLKQNGRVDVLKIMELYARLYWQYADLEDDDPDVFRSVNVNRVTLETGFASLAKNYPASDYIQNGWGKFACLLGNRDEYMIFHTRLSHRYSAKAWSKNVTLEGCNKEFGIK